MTVHTSWVGTLSHIVYTTGREFWGMRSRSSATAIFRHSFESRRVISLVTCVSPCLHVRVWNESTRLVRYFLSQYLSVFTLSVCPSVRPSISLSAVCIVYLSVTCLNDLFMCVHMSCRKVQRNRTHNVQFVYNGANWGQLLLTTARKAILLCKCKW